MSSDSFNSDTLPQISTALVVGAGPTGLACAIALRKAGVDVIIVDAAAAGAKTSRATVLHPHTLEVLESLDCAAPILSVGLQGHGFAVSRGKKLLFRSNLQDGLLGKTKYPFTIFNPQSETERILLKKFTDLGGVLYRNKKIVSYEEATGGVRVFFESGETVVTRYLVGADGSKSTIRKLSGLRFTDPKTDIPYESHTNSPGHGDVRFAFADVYLSFPVPDALVRECLNIHFAPGALSVFIPQPHASNASSELEGCNPSARWRFATSLRPSEPDAPKNIDLPYIQSLLDTRTVQPVPFKVEKVIGGSRYSLKSAVVEKFFVPIGKRGKILLAGDAGHVHSPVGGQGANLGICDGVALARSIARHLAQDIDSNNNASDSILVEYSNTRRKVALEVVNLVDGMNNMLEFSSGWKRFVAPPMFYLLWCLEGMGAGLLNTMQMRIAGLRYRDSMPPPVENTK